MDKLVSIVVPNYNCGEYLDKCLEHIVNQTYTNFECIICDNASTDNSVEIIKQWVAKDSRLRLLTTEVNQGGLRCYNRLFSEAKGDYIMIQDSDDWCDLTRVEKQAAVLDKYDVGCCMVNSVHYSSHTEPEYPNQLETGILDIHSYEDWAPATVMFRRTVLDVIPGYNLFWDRVTSYDNYFLMDIIDRFGGYYLNEHLYFIWMRPNSDHRTINLDEENALRKLISYDVYKHLKQQRIETGTDDLKEGNMEALYAFEEELMSDKDYLADKVRVFACVQIDNGNLANGTALLMEAIKTSPTYLKNYQSFVYLLKKGLRLA